VLNLATHNIHSSPAQKRHCASSVASPFGSSLPNRAWSDVSRVYRYGFQNQEKDEVIYGEGNLINFKYRVEDVRIGKFLSIDPLYKKYPFYSTYSFSGNRVIDALEFEGLEPYILFKTETEAAINFGNQYNGKSIIQGVEYAANIFTKIAADGKTYYYYDQPNKGSATSSRPSLGWGEVFQGATKTARIHSHGEYLKKFKNNDFSPVDKKIAEDEELKSYITTPNGSLKLYDPKVNEEKDNGKTISEKLQSDIKDPDRKNKDIPIENPPPIKTVPIVPQKKEPLSVYFNGF
jgi:hypothetical protein